MKTLALVSQKGGSGKTTLAVHLAVCAIQKKKAVALIDIDQQGSAADWYAARDGDKDLAAIHATAEDLTELIKKAKAGGADLVIIDTAPHSDKAAAIAAKLADLVLIPCRPSRFDMKAIGASFEIIRLTKTPAFIVMNGTQPIGQNAENAKAALKAQKLPVLEITISQRVAFSHAVLDGRSVHEYEPEGKAAQEIDALFSFVQDRLKL
jgi:chromosome partitioning protein